MDAGAQVMLGDEVEALERVFDGLTAARGLVGRHDDLVASLIEEALERLADVTGRRAAPVGRAAAH